MLTIFETPNWVVTHRKDSRYSGALIIASKNSVSEISALSDISLSELGTVLARAEKLLISYFNPYRVVTAKLGFSTGYSCHFHMLPVSMDLLNEIITHPNYTNEPDGNDCLLFASREYGERDLTEDELEVQLEVVKSLREHALQTHKMCL